MTYSITNIFMENPFLGASHTVSHLVFQTSPLGRLYDPLLQITSPKRLVMCPSVCLSRTARQSQTQDPNPGFSHSGACYPIEDFFKAMRPLKKKTKKTLHWWRPQFIKTIKSRDSPVETGAGGAAPLLTFLLVPLTPWAPRSKPLYFTASRPSPLAQKLAQKSDPPTGLTSDEQLLCAATHQIKHIPSDPYPVSR